MIPDYLRQKKELIPLVLFGASAAFAVLILIKSTSFFVTLARAENIVERATAQNNTDPKDIDKYFNEYKALANGLKTHNLFVAPPPKQHPVKEVSGIFGDEVLIGGKWYKVGDKIGDAKILAIGSTSARIRWNGTEKTFLPIDARIPEAPKGSRTERAVAKAGGADMVVVGAGRESISDSKGKKKAHGGSSGEGRDGLKKVFEKMKQNWPDIYEQNRKKIGAIAEKWPKMSESQRQGVVKWLKNPKSFEKNRK